MAKKIKWAGKKQKDIPLGDRLIIESEKTTRTISRNYTLNQRQANIDITKAKIVKLQERLPELEADLKRIKSALKVNGG